MDREITLRDYGRVLWSGRWIIVAAVVAAAIVGLIVSVVSTTTYTARSKIFLGQATSVSGVVVPTPLTSPVTATDVLKGDDVIEEVANKVGVSEGRVRNGVSIKVQRVAGVSPVAQPGVAQITFRDHNRRVALEGMRAYRDAVMQRLDANYDAVRNAIFGRYQRAQRDVTRYKAQLASLGAQLRANPAQAVAYQSLIASAQGLFAAANSSLDTNTLLLAKAKQSEAPHVISASGSASSSGNPRNRAKTVLLSAIIGLLVGIIITFIWKGSPAGRAGASRAAT